MQGRLSRPEDGRIQAFPSRGWREEFSRAAEAGLTHIEWIYEVYGQEANPLGTSSGRSELSSLQHRTGVGLHSICADYFMDRPLVRCSDSERLERVSVLRTLIGWAGELGMQRIVLPFVDASALRGSDDKDQLVTCLTDALPAAEAAGVELHLETSLAPAEFLELLSRLPHGIVRVNYDTGNSASLGYDPVEELKLYGHRLGSVHIKDRVRGGGTVPLGTGDTHFDSFFPALRQTAYARDFILQAARGDDEDYVGWAEANRRFVERKLAAHGWN